jgi:hypothetical protein
MNDFSFNNFFEQGQISEERTKIDYNTELYSQKDNAEFGKLDMLVTDELINLCKKSKHIIIYGHSKSGKVILGRLISEKIGCDLIVSDDYMHLGWSDNMYYIKELLQTKHKEEQIIFEGVQACRLLRKGVQLNDYYPELVIHVTCNYRSIEQCYLNDGQQNKLKGGKVKRFNEKILDKIFYEWWDMLPKEKRPKIINIDTSFI